MSNESLALYFMGVIAVASLLVSNFPHIALLLLLGAPVVALSFGIWQGRGKRKRKQD